MKTLLLTFLVLVGCAGDDGDGGSTDVQTEQLNSACPSMPSILKGTTPVGQACTAATDCTPTCCSCSTGTNQYLGAACIDGACAAPCSHTTQGSQCQ